MASEVEETLPAGRTATASVTLPRLSPAKARPPAEGLLPTLLTRGVPLALSASLGSRGSAGSGRGETSSTGHAGGSSRAATADSTAQESSKSTPDGAFLLEDGRSITAHSPRPTPRLPAQPSPSTGRAAAPTS